MLISDQLPVPMRLDIAYCVRREVLKSIPSLEKCRKVVKQTIALAMKQQVCAASDFIYSAGDIGSDIYLFSTARSTFLGIASQKN